MTLHLWNFNGEKKFKCLTGKKFDTRSHWLR